MRFPTAMLCLLALSPLRATDLSALATDSAWQPGDPIAWPEARLSLTSSVRERLEGVNNWIDFDDNSDGRDGAVLLQRFRLMLDWNPAQSLHLVAETQDARNFFDESRGPVFTNREIFGSDDPFDLRQAWIGWEPSPGQPWGIRVGRQELFSGDQRFLGTDEWSNTGRTYDAVRVAWEPENLIAQAFAAWPVLVQSDRFNSPDTEELFAGIDATSPFIDGITSQAFVFYRSKSDRNTSTVWTDDDNQREGNPGAPGDYATLGVRFASTPGASFAPIDFRVEAALQAGEVSDPQGFGPTVGGRGLNQDRQNLLAGAVHAELGWTPPDADWHPRLFSRGGFASGDANPSDGSTHSFQPLHPSPHNLHGLLDRFIGTNLIEAAAGFSCRPHPAIDLETAYHAFWLAETGDAWRTNSGTALGGAPRYARALNGDPSPFAGHEIDLQFRWRATRWLSIHAGYGHFFPGGYVRDTATAPGSPADGIDSGFLSAVAEF